CIIAIDLLPMEPVADVTFILGDFREEEGLRALEAALPPEANGKVDLVLSDMAPNLSGVGVADAARMTNLAELALEFAKEHLKPDGALLIKCFHGSGYSQIVEAFKGVFKTVSPRKPKASRDKSSETFLLGRYLK
ncbi:MAG: RlmE family RNA methyltransferase, partial [Burkholderiaceae bacterium]|nr:RlmE family RNA methyltransferase [Burkholderiaceae bacterium]